MRQVSALTLFACISFAIVGAQTAPPVTITQRLDTPQARVYVATLSPHAPVVSKNGHATHRALIYMDDGVMTIKDGADTATIKFKRGDVRWRPAGGPYTAENTSDHPIRILEIDLKGPPAGPAAGHQARSGRRRSAALQGRLRKRIRPRAARALRPGREGRQARAHPESRRVLRERSAEREGGRCADVGSGDARRSRTSRRSRRIGSRWRSSRPQAVGVSQADGAGSQ